MIHLLILNIVHTTWRYSERKPEDSWEPDHIFSPNPTKLQANRNVVVVEIAGRNVYYKAPGLYHKYWKYTQQWNP